MSFIIKGIDLPEKGDTICLEIYSDGSVWDKSNWEPHPPKVSAIQIPKGHGNIKDIKAIFEDLNRYQIEYNADINEVITDAPTILETEEE